MSEEVFSRWEDPTIEKLQQENQRLKETYTNAKMILGQNQRLKEEINKLKEENKRLEENNSAMQEEMARTWKKLDDLKEIEREHQKINGELREEITKLKEPTTYFKYASKSVVDENKQLKDVIEEVREYIKEHPCDTWYYVKKKSTKQYDYEVHRCDEEVLQILDKAKGEK